MKSNISIPLRLNRSYVNRKMVRRKIAYSHGKREIFLDRCPLRYPVPQNRDKKLHRESGLTIRSSCHFSLIRIAIEF